MTLPSELDRLRLRRVPTPELLEHLVAYEAGATEHLPMVDELRSEMVALESDMFA